MIFFKFTPLLKTTVWGGQRIAEIKNNLPQHHNISHIGESWEISGLPDAETCVSHGAHSGQPLSTLIAQYGDDLLGTGMTAKYGQRFPLLVKFIDAQYDLSIQVHPNDTLATRLGLHNGKTEMWYVIHADPQTHLLAGFSQGMTQEILDIAIKENTLQKYLNNYAVKAGDCFYIPAGCIHAICSGTFLIEIQQCSDTTYRVFDYNRKDLNGELRELHTQQAQASLNYEQLHDCQQHYVTNVSGITPLIKSPHFDTQLITLTDTTLDLSYPGPDTFHIFVCFQGECTFATTDGLHTTTLTLGETLLVPAALTSFSITPQKNSTKLICASLF